MEALSEARPAAGGTATGGALVFVGFMGAGKSSAARTVAAELGVRPVDSDLELEREFGVSLEVFFDEHGEPAFREREEQTVLRLLADPPSPVLALGGGAVESEAVRDALAAHTVVHLEVEPEEAWRRASGKGRPLARDRRRFDELHGARARVYASVANATVPPGDRDTVRRALPSLRALPAAPRGTRLIWAHAESSDYPVLFGRDLVAEGVLPALEGRPFAVTDANVSRHHAVRAPWQHVLRPGESEKTMARAEETLRAMTEAGLTRADYVLAVGGGVVGDLAGFCAAVYQRGVRHVQLPTTLVAQVDSAFGGKTGVDLPEAKNYVGAYLQPSGVVVDPSVLATLPAEERAAGYAEVLKTALIAGGGLWARVRSGGEPDDAVIMGCLRTKLGVVAADERDDGVRQVLNLGHTVAHALEAATGYERFRHGEAVAIGLMCALRLSDREALRAEVAELLGAHGLPVRAHGIDPQQVIELLARDKKRVAGEVPFVLVEAPGRVTAGHVVGPASVKRAVEEVCAS